MKKFLIVLSVMVSMLASLSHVLAADFPDRPVKFIIPYGPGGGSDQLMRIIEPAASKALGQSFNFVYKPGAGGSVGSSEIAHSKPDGYTIGHDNYSVLYTNTLLGLGTYKRSDIQPICSVAWDPVVIAGPKGRWKNFEEFVAEAKAKPNTIKVGNSDRLGGGHLASLKLKAAGVPINIVPFASGGSKCLPAFLGGQVDAICGSSGAVLIIRDKLQPLAVTVDKRSPALPDTPTTEELGYPTVKSFMYRLCFAPAGVPAERFAKLEDCIRKALEDPDVRQRITNMGLVPDFMDSKTIVAHLNELEPLTAETAALIKTNSREQ